jgi:hypothetical protein
VSGFSLNRVCFKVRGSSSISVGGGQAASFNPLKSFDEPPNPSAVSSTTSGLPDELTFLAGYRCFWVAAATEIEEDPSTLLQSQNCTPKHMHFFSLANQVHQLTWGFVILRGLGVLLHLYTHFVQTYRMSLFGRRNRRIGSFITAVLIHGGFNAAMSVYMLVG